MGTQRPGVPRVRLNPAVSVIHANGRVLVRSDVGTLQLRGAGSSRLFHELIPLLDGTRDRRAVVAALGAYPRRAVLAALDRLERHHIIENCRPDGDGRWRGQVEFFRQWPDRPDDAAERLRRARVLLVGLAPWGAAAAVELAASGVGSLHLVDGGRVTPADLLFGRLWRRRDLKRSRAAALAAALTRSFPRCRVTSAPLTLTEPGELALSETEWDLTIAAGGRDELRLFQSVARFAHAHKIRSLFGSIDGLDAIVGPAVVPGRTACWNCARLRQVAASNDPGVLHDLHGALLGHSSGRRLHTYLAPMGPLAGQLLALEAVKLISGYAPSYLVGRILTQHLVTLKTEFHTVLRLPWCAVCGGSDGSGAASGGTGGTARQAGPPASRKHSRRRLRTSGDVRRVLDGLIDARTGIITHLTRVLPAPGAPELPIAFAASAASYTDGRAAPAGGDEGFGRGVSAADAMLSAAGEAVERYSAARRPAAGLCYAAFDDLAGDALDPRALCLYSARQYSRRGFPYAPFDPGRPIAWTRGWWADTRRPVWVPAQAVYWNAPEREDEGCCQVTTNGLAAGADVEDASMRAIMELVERDAFMLTWRARLPGRRLLLDDTVPRTTREVVRQVAERGVDVELFLLDGGLGLPVVACLGLGDGLRWPGVAVGLGAHWNARAAVRKAALEMAMIGPYISRLQADQPHRIPRTPAQVHTTTDHGLYYAPARRKRAVAFLSKGRRRALPMAALPEPRRPSLPAYARRLAAAGVRIALVDVTSSDLLDGPFRVVRAVGTNMQPLDFGFTCERTASPRLTGLLRGRANAQPHPLT